MSLLRLPVWCAQSRGTIVAALGEMGICPYCMMRFVGYRNEKLYGMTEAALVEAMFPEDLCAPVTAPNLETPAATGTAHSAGGAAKSDEPTTSMSADAPVALVEPSPESLVAQQLRFAKTCAQTRGYCPTCFDMLPPCEEVYDFVAEAIVTSDYEFDEFFLSRTIPAPLAIRQHGAWMWLQRKFPTLAPFSSDADMETHIVELKEAIRIAHVPRITAALNRRRALAAQTTLAEMAAERGLPTVPRVPRALAAFLPPAQAAPASSSSGADADEPDAALAALRLTALGTSDTTACTDISRLHTRLINLTPAAHVPGTEAPLTTTNVYLAAEIEAAAEAELNADIERSQSAAAGGWQRGGNKRGGHQGRQRGNALSINSNIGKTIGRVRAETLEKWGFSPPRLPAAGVIGPGSVVSSSGPQVPYAVQCVVDKPVIAGSAAAAAAAAAVAAASRAAASPVDAAGAACPADAGEEGSAKRACPAPSAAVAASAAPARPAGGFSPVPLAVLLSRPAGRTDPRTGLRNGAVIQLSPYLCLEVACSHKNLLLQGSYKKLSRVVSQSAWYAPTAASDIVVGSAAAAGAATGTPAAAGDADVALDGADEGGDDKDGDNDDDNDEAEAEAEAGDDADGAPGASPAVGGVVAKSHRGFQKTHATTVDDDEGGPFAESSVEAELAFTVLPHFWPCGAGYMAAPRVLPPSGSDAAAAVPAPAIRMLAADPNGVRARSEAACTSPHRVDVTALGFTRAPVAPGAEGAAATLARLTDAEPSSLVAYSGYRFKFHSSGREDLNVRMLGGGRHFFLEIVDPHRTPRVTPELLAALAAGVNAGSRAVALAGPLAAGDEKSFNEMTRGISEKRKRYRCVVYCERPLSDAAELAKAVDHPGELVVTQDTPLRVLLRRSALARTRVVSNLRTQFLSPHWFVLDLETQAGTYVKEFVHSDKGRTTPNVSAMLGSRCTIIQLDVTDLVMN